MKIAQHAQSVRFVQIEQIVQSAQFVQNEQSEAINLKSVENQSARLELIVIQKLNVLKNQIVQQRQIVLTLQSHLSLIRQIDQRRRVISQILGLQHQLGEQILKR